jgi:hypothetical protein
MRISHEATRELRIDDIVLSHVLLRQGLKDVELSEGNTFAQPLRRRDVFESNVEAISYDGGGSVSSIE